MGRPTAQELDTAIQAAIRMRESGKDPEFMAKSLLNLNYRVEKLEKVMAAARRYLHAGQSVSEHRLLMLAVQAAEKSERVPDDRDSIPTLYQH